VLMLSGWQEDRSNISNASSIRWKMASIFSNEFVLTSVGAGVEPW
jgi:hypothetical protein